MAFICVAKSQWLDTLWNQFKEVARQVTHNQDTDPGQGAGAIA